jgi:hypothetical protein
VKINELKKKLNSISKFNLNKKKEEYVIETKKINKLLKKPIPKTSTEIVRIIKIINFKK